MRLPSRSAPRGRPPGVQCGPRFPAPAGSGEFPGPNSRLRVRDRPLRPATTQAGARISRSRRNACRNLCGRLDRVGRARPESPAQAPVIPPKAALPQGAGSARTTDRSGRPGKRRDDVVTSCALAHSGAPSPIGSLAPSARGSSGEPGTGKRHGPALDISQRTRCSRSSFCSSVRRIAFMPSCRSGLRSPRAAAQCFRCASTTGSRP